MAPPEVGPDRQKESEKGQKIDGFTGLERLNTVEQLKQGAFREFLNQVMRLRQDPEGMKKIEAELLKQDKKRDTKGMRMKDAARLFAVIGKKVELTDTGMKITCDFGKLSFAEKRAIGAGHILPPSVQKIASGGTDKKSPTLTARTVRESGAGYFDDQHKYQSVFTGTEIFIPYGEIKNIDATKGAAVEARLEGKAAQVASGSRADRGRVQDSVPPAPEQAPARTAVAPRQTPTAAPTTAPASAATGPTATAETGPVAAETQKTSVKNVMAFGDSQMQGIARMGGAPFEAQYKVGARISKVESIMRQYLPGALRANPSLSTIYVQTGGNDRWDAGRIGWKKTVEHMQRDMRHLVAAVKEINRTVRPSPPLRIVVGTLMPYEKTPGEIQSDNDIHQTCVAYNEWLRQDHAKEGFAIFDGFRAIEAAPGTFAQAKQYQRKGGDHHLNGRGYKRLAQAFLEQHTA